MERKDYYTIAKIVEAEHKEAFTLAKEKLKLLEKKPLNEDALDNIIDVIEKHLPKDSQRVEVNWRVVALVINIYVPLYSITRRLPREYTTKIAERLGLKKSWVIQLAKKSRGYQRYYKKYKAEIAYLSDIIQSSNTL